jgi:hypothetical protein
MPFVVVDAIVATAIALVFIIALSPVLFAMVVAEIAASAPVRAVVTVFWIVFKVIRTVFHL